MQNYEYSVLTTVLLLEQNSQNFIKTKELAEDEEGKKLFEKLEKWEFEHYQMLLDEYNNMNLNSGKAIILTILREGFYEMRNFRTWRCRSYGCKNDKANG